MSWKMVRTAVIVILTAVLIAAWLLWLRVGPSFSPDDVTLRGKLLPITSLPDAKPLNGETLAAEVAVKRDANVLLLGRTAGNDYLYVYAPGTQMTKISIVEEPQSNVLRPAANADVQQQVLEMLKQVGLSVVPEDLYEQQWQYAGAQSNYTVRLLLKQQPAASAADAPDRSAYAVYVHEERKWGRNVSWTKAVKLESQK